MTIAFDDDIPAKGPELFIKRLNAGESRSYTVLGTKHRGVWIHWNPQGNCSEAHSKENCNGCLRNMPKRWKGFLHCWDDAASQEIFLELTPTSAAAIKSNVLSITQYRGTVMTVSRGPKTNSRLSVFVQSYRRDPKTLPPEKDPRPSILKLWGVLTEANMADLEDGEIEELHVFDGKQVS